MRLSLGRHPDKDRVLERITVTPPYAPMHREVRSTDERAVPDGFSHPQPVNMNGPPRR